MKGLKENKTLNSVLNSILQKRNLKSNQVAKALGISPTYFSLVKDGKRRVPSGFIDKITEVLLLSHSERADVLEVIMNSEKERVAKAENIAKEIITALNQLFLHLQMGLQSTKDANTSLFERILDLFSKLKETITGEPNMKLV